jgi:hypothetical protein
MTQLSELIDLKIMEERLQSGLNWCKAVSQIQASGC